MSEIRRSFRSMLTTSLNADQINYVAQRLDGRFDVYNVSGFGRRIAIPSEVAAESLLRYFRREQDIVYLFTELLALEGKRISNVTVQLHNKESMFKLLEQAKWIYDRDLHQFHRDPFYEERINFLKAIRNLDLRNHENHEQILKQLREYTDNLLTDELDWQVTVRLYSLQEKGRDVIKEMIKLLLTYQHLSEHVFLFYTCLKELVVNASKANYKTLFEKYVTRPQGITIQKNNNKFLEMFRQEIEQNGEKNLLEYAQKEDQYINVIFQSTRFAMTVWVTNYADVTPKEKNNLLKKLNQSNIEDSITKSPKKREEQQREGAGLGINLVLELLRSYSRAPSPLKVVFYPQFMKIGFQLSREELENKHF